MSPLIYALLAIIGIGAAGFALVPSLLGSSRADKRKKALQGDIQANRRVNTEERSRDARRAGGLVARLGLVHEAVPQSVGLLKGDYPVHGPLQGHV